MWDYLVSCLKATGKIPQDLKCFFHSWRGKWLLWLTTTFTIVAVIFHQLPKYYVCWLLRAHSNSRTSWEKGEDYHQILRGVFNKRLENTKRVAWHWEVWGRFISHFLHWRLEKCKTRWSQAKLLLCIAVGAREAGTLKMIAAPSTHQYFWSAFLMNVNL